MACFKYHTEVFTSSIIKLTLEELSADDQHRFEDIMKQEKEEALWQYVERHEKAKEKYLSNFTVDHHQKIIQQGDIEMASISPSFTSAPHCK